MKSETIRALFIFPVLVNFLTAAPQQRAAQTAVVRFGDLGSLSVQSIEPVGDQPELVISDSRGGRIFSARVGERSFPEEVIKPILRFAVVDAPGSKSPLILAVAVDTVADGCRSDVIVVGESGHALTNLPIAPRLQQHVWGEGVYLGDLNNNLGFGLAIWYPVIGDEAVMGDHRYGVSLYRFNPERSQFTLIKNLISMQTHHTPEDALTELGLPRYRDFGPC